MLIDVKRHDIKKERRVAGEERKKTKKTILKDGLMLARASKVIDIHSSVYKRNNLTVPSQEVLRVMKKEAAHEQRISNDPLRDIMNLKKAFFMCSFEIKKTQEIEGFIQEINADPFGFLLLCQLQVR